MIFNNKYEYVSNISSGEFGKVVKINYNNKFYALKIGEKKNIKYESEIYKKLRGSNNISNIYDLFEMDNAYCLLMDYYHMNLTQYKTQFYDSINYKNNLLNNIIDLCNIIKFIHSNDIIHRDLKPTNICLNTNYKLYLIDFGISKIYINKNKHIEEKNIKAIIGSINFSSLNIINLLEPSRRDDMESILYIFLYMILNNNYYIAYNNLDNYKKKDINIIIKIINLQYEYSKFNFSMFEKLFYYIRRLKFNQGPNYDYIITLLNKLFLT
jgi:serine/threonine protein kinase